MNQVNPAASDIVAKLWNLCNLLRALRRWKLPHQVRKGSGSFNPNDDTIKVLTMR